jgi:hypothetical protein
MICQACDHELDALGRCARCAGVLPEDIERLKRIAVYWIVCSAHGAHEVGREQHYRMEWSEPDPKDRRKKIRHHEWRYRCPKCDFMDKNTIECFKDLILLPEQVYRPLIDERLTAWGARE